MNRQQGIQWLYRELPTLLSKGVLSTETRLQQYYGTVHVRHRRALVLLVCGIFGAILIGLAWVPTLGKRRHTTTV